MVVAWSGVQECEFKDRAVVGLMFGRWRGGGGRRGTRCTSGSDNGLMRAFWKGMADLGEADMARQNLGGGSRQDVGSVLGSEADGALGHPLDNIPTSDTPCGYKRSSGTRRTQAGKVQLRCRSFCAH